MDKLPLLVFFITACANSESITDSNRGYADASECSESAMHKERIKVPTANSVSVIEIPITYVAGKFILCMKYAERPVSRVDATEYLNVSNACLHEARDAENPDESYAACVRLNVEVMTDE
ncbi:MAG: hypothetical protein BVN35_20130 [Proteobacteria bacterium ST_bin11]|nr:MAG: hypothetical protein BVN35_20130 [Proteobacteria bacterium ST_bin11]